MTIQYLITALLLNVSSFCYQLWGYTSPYILSIVIISFGSQVKSVGQIVCSFHFLGGQIWCMFLFVLCYVTSVMSDSCDPMDCSLSGSSVHVILQARTLEWVAISFSNAWKWKVKVKSLSHVWLLATPWTAAYQAPPSMGFSRQQYWSGVPLPSPPIQYTNAYIWNLERR